MFNNMFTNFQSAPAHVCGLYYTVSSGHWSVKKHFLPQVKLEAKATILATTSQTVLTQTFANPSTDKGIKECRYTFPLYDGVSVVGFTCHVGEREIVGQVKEREKARAVFEEAVSKGETAGLFEQLPDASDVFSTTVGNIPPGAKVIIRITYLGELKHDMEVDGIRFTIPTIICPRYGDYPGTLCRSPATDAMGASISITVDAEMADGSFIQKIQSPTHPIAMTMGTTSTAPNAEPTMTKASATLALGTAALDTDFVLQVIAKNTGVPKAILENHPTIPDHRALMATLVPKFALPPEKPEIVFVCDRSGSMQQTRIELAKQALKVFLKSLPVGVKFNICSFGSQHSFFWEKSVTYSQQTLDEAMNHANSFAANYGGTEMLPPLKATIERRYKDMPLNIMLLTDGEDWRQQEIFSYLNQSILSTKAPIRVFTLGIGNGVSHALIEGIAKAGNGFSQAVGEGEAMNTKVVRMLKGALSPYINDYTLEVKYNNDDISAHLDVEPEDDFEIVEKVSDSLKVKLNVKEDKAVPEPIVSSSLNTINKTSTDAEQKKPISLFDPLSDPDKEEPLAHDETGENRYAHLSKLPVPKIIQAPQNIPSLFAFHRTTVYLLLGPEAPQGTPKSVTLRGTSAHGPLELEIPIQVLDKPGKTIHQLAAKKAISELEQGRGWLMEAKDESNTLIKTKFEGRYDDMVEREAVRLGVQFQVGGKWCSFVAVETNKEEAEKHANAARGWEWLENEADAAVQSQTPFVPQSTFGTTPAAQHVNLGFTRGYVQRAQQFASQQAAASSGLYGNFDVNSWKSPVVNFAQPQQIHPDVARASSGLFGSAKPSGNNLFGALNMNNTNPSGAPSSTGGSAFGAARTNSGGLFGAAKPSGNNLFGSSNVNSGGFGSSAPNQNNTGSSLFSSPSPSSGGLFGAATSNQNTSGGSSFSAPGFSNGGLFGSSAANQNNTGSSLFSSPSPSSGGLFGAPAPSQNTSGGSLFSAPGSSSGSLFGSSTQNQSNSGSSLFSASNQPRAPSPSHARALQDYQMGLMVLEQQNKNRLFFARQENDSAGPNDGAAKMCLPDESSGEELLGEELVHHLISLQSFAGSWSLTSRLLESLGLDEAHVKAEMNTTDGEASLDETAFATALAITVFEDRLAEWNGSWELVVEKGRSWLVSEVGVENEAKYLDRARKVLG
jgi:hypothetical protein